MLQKKSHFQITPSVTEYLTPKTPDLLNIRLAWQSLAYTDQVISLTFAPK